MSLVERFELQHIDGPAGSIVVAQGERDVPFPIRRVYYLHSVPPNQTRGLHAHKSLTQLAVCVRGSCRFRLDDGRETAEVVLSNPHEGIIIRPMLWREMSEFSEDCVLLVLASDHYDESDYIRNYEDFKNAVAR
jgi:dTDP-4-dehydrorhamnose 3,5-epimerase-like enzyme